MHPTTGPILPAACSPHDREFAATVVSMTKHRSTTGGGWDYETAYLCYVSVANVGEWVASFPPCVCVSSNPWNCHACIPNSFPTGSVIVPFSGSAFGGPKR